jgi:hypothetical protein
MGQSKQAVFLPKKHGFNWELFGRKESASSLSSSYVKNISQQSLY